MLRDRITLQRPTLAPDDLGAGRPGFADVATVWAQALQIDADEPRGAWRIAIRLRRDVRPGWRVRCGDRALCIRAVAEAGADLIHLHCQEDVL